MNWRGLINKEEEIWHERFIPSLVAGGTIFLITLLLEHRGFDIVLLTSISASLVILTSQYQHRLTVLGTAIYSYLVAAFVGFTLRWVLIHYQLGLAMVSFLAIVSITLIIYLLNIVHPPAVGIALGIVLYQGEMSNLLIIFGLTFLMFFVVKFVMYFYSSKLVISKFHHEFLIWEKKLFRKKS